MNIADIRKEYQMQSLLESDVAQHPIAQFEKWWNQAIESHIEEVNAMTLATVGEQGMPSARIVLLKGFDADGFTFFTNYESRKGKELEKHPQACLVFFWKELERQIRIEGIVSKIDAAASDVYFNSRPTQSKIGAWTSPQSEEIASRSVLEEKYQKMEASFENQTIQRPPFWGGFQLKPNKIEYWQGREGRLHDRIQYKQTEDGAWNISRLAP